MKFYMVDAIKKLKDKEIWYGKPKDNFYSQYGGSGLVKLEDALQALEDLEIAILNFMDEKGYSLSRDDMSLLLPHNEELGGEG